MTQLNCIMLIDDNKIDNFFHERVIKKCNAAQLTVLVESGAEALEYLKNDNNIMPDLIFLDINMPGMTGWEFIDHYKELECRLKKTMLVIMLSTSVNPDDKEIACTQDILSDFRSKPLTADMLEEILMGFHMQT